MSRSWHAGNDRRPLIYVLPSTQSAAEAVASGVANRPEPPRCAPARELDPPPPLAGAVPQPEGPLPRKASRAVVSAIDDAEARLIAAIKASSTDPVHVVRLLADLALIVNLARRAEVLLSRVCAG